MMRERIWCLRKIAGNYEDELTVLKGNLEETGIYQRSEVCDFGIYTVWN